MNLSVELNWIFAILTNHARIELGEMHGQRRDSRRKNCTIVRMPASRHCRQSTTNVVCMRNRTGESFLEGDTTQYWSTDRPLIGMPTFLTFACTCELYWYFDNRLKGCPDKPVARLSKTVARADGRFICFLGVLWPPYGTACIGHALSAYNSRRSIQLQYTRP